MPLDIFKVSNLLGEWVVRRVVLAHVHVLILIIYLIEKLQYSTFSDDIHHIARCFDRAAKLKFRDSKEPLYIKFGRTRDRDDELGIRNGQLRISGYYSLHHLMLSCLALIIHPRQDIASFFEPCIRDIINGIEEQFAISKKRIHVRVLSYLLFSSLIREVNTTGRRLCCQ